MFTYLNTLYEYFRVSQKPSKSNGAPLEIWKPLTMIERRNILTHAGSLSQFIKIPLQSRRSYLSRLDQSGAVTDSRLRDLFSEVLTGTLGATCQVRAGRLESETRYEEDHSLRGCLLKELRERERKGQRDPDKRKCVGVESTD